MLDIQRMSLHSRPVAEPELWIEVCVTAEHAAEFMVLLEEQIAVLRNLTKLHKPLTKGKPEKAKAKSSK